MPLCLKARAAWLCPVPEPPQDVASTRQLRARPCVAPSSAPTCSLHSFQEHFPPKPLTQESPSQVLLLVNLTAVNTLYNTLGTDRHWKVMGIYSRAGRGNGRGHSHANKSCLNPRENFSNCSLRNLHSFPTKQSLYPLCSGFGSCPGHDLKHQSQDGTTPFPGSQVGN